MLLRFRLTIILTLALGGLCLISTSTHADTPSPSFESTECPFSIPPGRVIQCGFLNVPQDRAQANELTIKLGVAIIKSRAPNPQPDPLIFLNGGPGAHALLGFSKLFSLFQVFLGDLNRDVILFDQCGVGWSQPALECPELGPTLLRQMRGEILTREETQAPYLACRDRWASVSVDLSAYTTAASAADVNALWRTLGYPAANLYGVSYGTVVAQTVMRDYPAGIRSVILDSAYPLEISLTTDSAINMHTGLQQVFENCAADVICRAIYPNLETVYLDLLGELNRTPARLTLADPVTAETVTITFDAADLGDIVRLLPAREIPGLIYDLHDHNFTTILEGQREMLKAIHQFGAPPGRALAISIFCSQAMYGQTDLQSPNATGLPEATWAERFNADLTPLPCSQWPTRGAPDARAALSHIPTLILSGQDDLTRSTHYDELLTHNLSHSQLIVVPNVGHQVMRSPCVASVAHAFLNEPLAVPNAACVALAHTPILNTRFAVRAAVTRWPTLILLGALTLFIGARLALGLGGYRIGLNGLALRLALRVVSLVPALIGAIVVGLALQRGGEEFLWTTQTRALELTLALIAALQAALIFVPEDEPTLEVVLASPRPLAWLALERLAVLSTFIGGAGLALSLWVNQSSAEAFAQSVLRWGPPTLFFSGLAFCVTLITRRAVFSLALIGLLWFVVSALGDLVIKVWPFVWPLNPYLQPDHADYLLNRWLIASAGLAFITWGLTLMSDEERLLLGGRHGGKQGNKYTGKQVHQEANNQRSSPVFTCLRLYLFTHLPVSLFTFPLHQFLAMLRYEFHLQWRRRAVSVMLLSMIALSGLAALTLGRQARISAGAINPEQARQLITAQMRPAMWGVLFGFLVLFAPAVVAETIPKDQQHGVRELLESLPLSPGLYLAGKVISVWIVLLAGLALNAFVNGVLWWGVVGPFDWPWYLEMWLVGALPLVLMNPSLGVLLAAGQPTQRRALLVGVALAVALIILQVPGFLTLNNAWGWVNPGRSFFFLYFLVNHTAPEPLLGTLLTWLTPEALRWSILAGLAQVAALWILVWAWMRRATII